MNPATAVRDLDVLGRRLALVVTTEHDRALAMTAIHRRHFPNCQGGVRFVREGSLEELAHLAIGMTEKCAASGVPLDGLKTLIVAEDPGDDAWKAAIVSEHIRAVIVHEPAAIFGPDMGCGESVLTAVARGGLLAHVTGLAAECGGVEINQRGYTALGVVEAIETAMRGRIDQSTVAIQGFGAVGAHCARLLAERGARIVAVCNQYGTLADPRGLDAHALLASWMRSGDAGLAAHGPLLPRAEIFRVPAHIFVPAARTSVLALPDELAAARAENAEAVDVTRYFEHARPRLIAEAANHPLTNAAERFLEAQGTIVLPDVIINCGGMIGCYAEWQNRQAGDPLPLARLDALCRETIRARVRENTRRALDGDRGARNMAREIIEWNLSSLPTTRPARTLAGWP